MLRNDSINVTSLNNLDIMQLGNFSTPSTSFTPADMGYGIFNMPVMPMNFQNNIWAQAAFSNPLSNPFNTSALPFNMGFLQTGFLQGIDWQKNIQNTLNMQEQYMNNLKNQMAMLLKSATSNLGQTNFSGDSLGGYGNYNFNVTKMYTGTAADLDKHLKGVMKGKGSKLIELQNKYGINAAFLAALVNAESAHGTSSAARNKNNVAGIMSPESGYKEQVKFSSVDACLEALAQNLSKNYVGQGLVTISQIHKKYCPIGAENDPTGLNKNWGSTIAQLTEKYELA